MAEAALHDDGSDERIYLAAAVVVSVSQRLQKSLNGTPVRSDFEDPQTVPLALVLEQHAQQDLECVMQLEHDLSSAAATARAEGKISFFVALASL